MAITSMQDTERARARLRRRGRLAPRRVLGAACAHVTITVALVFMAAPFLWMLSSAFKDSTAVLTFPPQWIPSPPTLDSIKQFLNSEPLGSFYANSLKIALSITVGQLVFCSSAAYAFARLRFPGRELLFGIYLSSLLVPEQITIIPLYIVMKHLGLLDNQLSLILPGLTSAFGTFLLRQFFLSIPYELEEAARVDGAGPFRILATIYMPLSGAALATLAIFSFNYYWNELFRPLIFLSSISNMTVPLGLASVLGQFNQNQALLMAGVTLAVLPVLALYLIAQRYIVEGITLTGLKG